MGREGDTDRVAARGPPRAVPLGYLALAIAASWPLARDFATYTVGDVHYDERHAIWVLWYTAQALPARVSWPDTTQLLFPHGISVLVDGVGPLNASWRCRSGRGAQPRPSTAPPSSASRSRGWCLYALARGIGLARGPAFVAGALFLLWPIHLISLTGHLEKLFVGMLPLTLLAGLRAFDPDRATRMARGARRGAARRARSRTATSSSSRRSASRWSACRRGWQRRSTSARPRLRRMLIAGALSLAICAPLLLAIVHVMRDPTL